MQKSFKYIGFTVLIVIVILLIAPLFIPLDKYKGILLKEIKEKTGREMVIEGDMRLSLLPKLSVVCNNIKLSSLPGAKSPYLFASDKLSVSLSLLPLFAGKVVVSKLELDKPKVILEVLADGRQNWQFTAESQPKAKVTQTTAAKSDEASFSLPVRSFKINHGEIEYIKGQSQFKISNITTSLTAKSQHGPITFTSDFETLGYNFGLDGKIEEIANTLPIELNLKLLGEQLKIAGKLALDTMSFAGSLGAEGNAKTLVKKLNLAIPAQLAKEYTLHSKLEINKAAASIDDIAFSLGDIKATGKGQYLLEDSAGKLNLNLDPGKVAAEISLGGAISGIRAAIASPDMIKFLAATGVEDQKLKNFSGQDFAMQAVFSSDQGLLNIRDLALAIGKTKLKGALSTEQQANKSYLTYNLNIANAMPLINLLSGKQKLNLDNIQLDGKTIKDGSKLDTNTNIRAAKANTNISGQINTGSDKKLALNIAASGDSLAATLFSLTNNSSLAGLGQFNVSATLNGDWSKQLQLALNSATLNMKDEKSTLKGDATIAVAGAKPKVSVNLGITSINLDKLLGKMPVTSSYSAGKSSAQGSAVSATPWSSDPIDLTFLQGFDGDLSCQVQKLVKGSLKFQDIKTSMTLSNGVANINSLTGNLYGGSLEASGSVSSLNEQAVNFKATLRQANLHDITPSRNEFKITKGIFNLDGNFSSKGSTQYQYVSNLSGNVNFDAAGGRLHGIDLQKVVAAIAKAKNAETILTVMDSAFAGGDTDFSNLEATLAIQNGIAQLSKFKLTANQIIATASGNVDLPKYTLNINSTINVGIKDLPPFKARLYGRLDNPQHSLETGALMQYLLQNVLKNITNSVKDGITKPENILKGLLGGGTGNDADNGASPDSQQKINPGDLIQKGLEGIFKGF